MTAIVFPHVCCNDGIITDLSSYGCIPGNLGLGEAAKSGISQTTGTSKTDVVSQDGATKAFVLKKSKDPFESGNHKIVSDSDYASLELANSAGWKLSLETLPENNEFSGNIILRDSTGNVVSVIKIPRSPNDTLATLTGLRDTEKKAVQAFRYSSVRTMKTAVNYWAPASEGEFVIGIRTALDGGGIWIITDVKVATLQVFIDGKWVNIQNA